MQPRNIVAVYFSDRYFLHIPYSQGDKSLGRTSRCQAGHGMTWNDQALWSWARSNMGRLQRPLTCRSHPWPNLSAHAGKPRVSNPHGIVIVIFNVVEFPYGQLMGHQRWHQYTSAPWTFGVPQPSLQVTSWSLNLGNLVPTASYWHRQLTSERTMPQCIQYTTWEQLERKVCSIDRCWKGVPSIRFLGGSCQDWPITVSWMQVQQSRHAVDVDETQATIWRLWWG